MEKIELNKGWLFRRIGEDFECRVDIPHDAMLGEKRTPSSPGGVNTGWFEGHDYQYRRTISIDKADIGKNFLLEFEGVYHDAEIYINDELIYSRPYGYSDFFVDVTEKLKAGDNELKVLARNADQPNSRWYSGAGIYRPVYLYVFDKDRHIVPGSIRIKTRRIRPAIIEVQVQTVGKGTLVVSIADGNACLASQAKEATGEDALTFEIDDATYWSADDPKLYCLTVSFGDDCVSIPFGIRTIEWGDDGFKVNEERVLLKGACIHHDNGPLGAIADESADLRRVRLLKSVGYNAIRSAHNPISKSLLDACDRLGMYVLDEFTDCWYIHKTAHDYADDFDKWHEQDLKDMVLKDVNHPSVIMYSIGNEVAETGQEKGIALTEKMTGYLHSLDDTRPVTCGINIFFNFLFSIGLGVYSDKKAKKNGKVPEKKRKKVGSEFFNNLAGLLGDEAMKTGATLPMCDGKTREAFASMDIAGYNYGIKRYRHDLKKYPHRVILGTETFCNDEYKWLQVAKKNPRLIGDFVWTGMDYLGEVGIGSYVHHDYADDFGHGVGWLTAGSGRIDITGKELGEALYTKVVFEKSPLEMAVEPVPYYRDKHSPSSWKMNETIDSWTYPGFEGRKTFVEVYTLADTVRLYLDGKCIGTKKRNRKDAIVRFHLKYRPGTLAAEGLDEEGKVVGRKSLTTAGKDIALRAYPEAEEIKGDGLAYVRFKLADSSGIYNPLARDFVTITDLQNGTLEALASACPYNPLGYKGEKTETYLGEALAILRPIGKGDLSFVARSLRHGDVSVTIKVID